MSLVEFNWNPTDRQLRQFGGASLIALPLIGFLGSAQHRTILGLAAVGTIVAAVSWVRPRWVTPLFLGAAILATPIGMVVGELMMLLIYWLVFVPMGLLFRIVGRDSLRRRGGPQDSYWTPIRTSKSVASYYRQS